MNCLICCRHIDGSQICSACWGLWIGSTYQNRWAGSEAAWASTIFFDWINLKRLENLNGERQVSPLQQTDAPKR